MVSPSDAQPGVGDLRAAEVEIGETGQPLQMRQPGVGDLRTAEVEEGEFGQPLQMCQPGVGDLSAVEVAVPRAWSAPSDAPAQRR